jgi:hypothetical protein
MKKLFLAIMISSYSYNFLQAAQDPFTTPKRERKSEQSVIVVTPAHNAPSADRSSKNDNVRIFSSALYEKLDHGEVDYLSDTSYSSQQSTEDSCFKALIDQHIQKIEFGGESSRVDRVIVCANKRSKREEETSQVAVPADMPKSSTQEYYDEAVRIIRKKNDINMSSTTALSLFADYLRRIKKSTIPKNMLGQNPAHFVYNQPEYKAFLEIITRFRPAWLSEADHCGILPAAYKAAPNKPKFKQKRKKRK